MLEPPTSVVHTQVRYAGFLPRLGAFAIDCMALSPALLFALWGLAQSHRAAILSILVLPFAFAAYHIYCVGRWGRTPGKALLALRIRREDGKPVDYRVALRRCFVALGYVIALTALWLSTLWSFSWLEYDRLGGEGKAQLINWHTPALASIVDGLMLLWVGWCAICIIRHPACRAPHDLLAGTVVTFDPPAPRPLPVTIPDGRPQVKDAPSTSPPAAPTALATPADPTPSSGQQAAQRSYAFLLRCRACGGRAKAFDMKCPHCGELLVEVPEKKTPGASALNWGFKSLLLFVSLGMLAIGFVMADNLKGGGDFWAVACWGALVLALFGYVKLHAGWMVLICLFSVAVGFSSCAANFRWMGG